MENYLCKMSPDEFAVYRDMIPQTLTGREYHDLYGRLPDTVTRVDPSETYHPRACAEHPILENERVGRFFNIMQVTCLRQKEIRDQFAEAPAPGARSPQFEMHAVTEAGRLMYQSHASYSDRLDLGSPETDLLVDLVRERGPEYGLYGAKITGGGSGGTVAIRLRQTARCWP